jgi:nicotinamide-nucleotide amidase
MSPSNRQQAMIPEGAELILNPTGTAPGFRVDLSSSRRIWFLPGVPPEMERMWADAVEPQLRESFRLKPTLRRLFRVMGKGESQLQDLLGELPQQFPGIELGFRTRMPENQVKLRAAPGTEGFESAAAWVRERLGKDCFSEDEDVSLAAAVGQLLVGRGEMLAIAESCTGGWIAHLCVTEPGSSRWLERSWVTYSNGAKEEELGVPARLLARVGAVAEETARKMARGARTRSGAAWGLAVTGIAGPSGGTAEKPIGMVCFAVDGPAGAHARTLQLGPRDRGTIRRWASWFALDLLRRQLLRVEAEQRQAAISADPGVGTA